MYTQLTIIYYGDILPHTARSKHNWRFPVPQGYAIKYIIKVMNEKLYF